MPSLILGVVRAEERSDRELLPAGDPSAAQLTGCASLRPPKAGRPGRRPSPGAARMGTLTGTDPLDDPGTGTAAQPRRAVAHDAMIWT